MRTYILEKESFINESPEEVFTFFSSAENLEKVTSARLHFETLFFLTLCLSDLVVENNSE